MVYIFFQWHWYSKIFWCVDVKYAPFGTLLQKSTYYVIVCFDKHCTDVSRQIVSYLYKCTYVHIYKAFFLQWLDLGPLYKICQVKVLQSIFQTAQLWFLCIVNLVWKNVFNLDKSISVAHRSNCIEKVNNYGWWFS